MPCITLHFNPRSPHGERRAFILFIKRQTKFQSTLPARGATFYQFANIVDSDNISIHAPRTGSDATGGDKQAFGACNFNPRSPHGERQGTRFKPTAAVPISIHAPRTGSDIFINSYTIHHCYFNPRSPHGERLAANAELSVKGQFQSTLPARGATPQELLLRMLKRFQSTLPARGATSAVMTDNNSILLFQSTLPARGATDGLIRGGGARGDFNPRSPHGERQNGYLPSNMMAIFQSTLPARGATLDVCTLVVSLEFQSTLPARGATNSYEVEANCKGISIHAPRTGSDNYWYDKLQKINLFQSTLPARGATQSVDQYTIHKPFQSTLPARGATAQYQ